MGLFIFTHETIVLLEVIKIHFNVRVVKYLNIIDIFILVLLIRFLSQIILVEVYLRIEIDLWLLVFHFRLLLVLITRETYHTLNLIL